MQFIIVEDDALTCDLLPIQLSIVLQTLLDRKDISASEFRNQTTLFHSYEELFSFLQSAPDIDVSSIIFVLDRKIDRGGIQGDEAIKILKSTFGEKVVERCINTSSYYSDTPKGEMTSVGWHLPKESSIDDYVRLIRRLLNEGIVELQIDNLLPKLS